MNDKSIPQQNHSCIGGKLSASTLPVKDADSQELQYLIYRTHQSAPEKARSGTKKSYNFFNRLGNPKNPFIFSAATLLPLMISTGNFSILTWLADRCGFVLFKLPTVITKDEIDKIRLNFISMASEALKTAAKNNVTENRDEILRDLYLLLIGTTRFRSALKGKKWAC